MGVLYFIIYTHGMLRLAVIIEVIMCSGDVMLFRE